MPKKIVWQNPNKMIFESSYLSYNNYVQIISSGNTIARGWTSMYVRSWNTTACNGKINPPGYLTKWDVNNFGSNLPGNIQRYILDYTEANPNDAFCWAHMSNNKGASWYMIYNSKRIIKTWVKSAKQYDVCIEASKYLID